VKASDFGDGFMWNEYGFIAHGTEFITFEIEHFSDQCGRLRAGYDFSSEMICSAEVRMFVCPEGGEGQYMIKKELMK
jgi:hypothetical protein